MLNTQGLLRDTEPGYLSEAFLATLDLAALGPVENLEAYLSDWQDWLGLRVKAGEISAAAGRAYVRGAKAYFSFTKGCNPTDPEMLRVWKADLLERYDAQTANTWLAGVRSFVDWRVETQRFL